MSVNNITKTDVVVVLLLLLAMTLIVYNPASAICADLYTIDASNVTSGSVDLNVVVNVSQNVWFEIGRNSGTYPIRTENVSASAGNVSLTLAGKSYLYPTYKYYYRARCANCSGNEFNFTMSAATPMPTQTFSTYVEDLKDSSWNISALVPVVGGAYTDAFSALGAPGTIFYAIVWLFIFVALWMRQENMSIAIMLFLILLPVIAFSGFLPGDWVYLSYLIVVVSIAGLLYYLWKGR